MRTAKDYNKDKWSEYFRLDENSPSGIVWNKSGNNKKEGKPVGWINDKGYWKCELFHKSVLIHRVVYFLGTGILDELMVIDHIDGDTTNNSFNNLRMVSYADNCRNRKKSSNNSSGYNGVQERHDFVAQWTENGKIHTKSFKVKDYGREVALSKAIEYRQKKIELLQSMGFNYTDDHGKRK